MITYYVEMIDGDFVVVQLFINPYGMEFKNLICPCQCRENAMKIAKILNSDHIHEVCNV